MSIVCSSGKPFLKVYERAATRGTGIHNWWSGVQRISVLGRIEQVSISRPRKEQFMEDRVEIQRVVKEEDD